jgi:pimeloyl-ACP methyl ester carboxylesterase
VARAAYRSLTRYNYARVRYPLVSVPVTLIYSELDWSYATERNEVARALANFQRFVLLEVGHFSAMEHPREVAEILIQAGGLP